MLLFLSHESALEYWRAYRSGMSTPGIPVRGKTPPDSAQAIKDLPSLGDIDLSLPLDILVSSDRARKVNSMVKSHISSCSFPNGSFLKIGINLFVSSPELCFLQMASQLELVQLIRLGFELCGSYRHAGYNEAFGEDESRGFFLDKPLTSTKKLSAFILKLGKVKGKQKASRAVRYLIDGSASPAETILTMMITLPIMLGGFGFPAPSLNTRIDIVSTAKKTAAKKHYSCDLFWSEAKIALEYDSDAFHSKTEQIASDAARRNALSYIGINVITVTRKQLVSSIEMRRIAHLLGKHLDKRLIYHDPEFTEAHMQLRSLLLADGSLSTGFPNQLGHEHHLPGP